MSWIQLRVHATEQTAEAIADVISDFGAASVTFIDGEDTPIYEPLPGEVRYWSNTIVIGLFDAEEELQPLVTQLRALPFINGQLHYKIEQLEDKDWEREWMDNFHPMKFGKRLWICPSWREVQEPNAVNVMLDPGLAFGTGTHPTTAMCLRWLDSLDLTGKTVVDFGCGSGILGIAALKLGAKRVIGIDIDPQAIEASLENAKRNGVAEQIELYLPKDQPTLTADVVVANILAGPLKELAEVIMGYMHSGTQFALSGILENQASSVSEAYAPRCELDAIATEDEWVRISGRHR